MEIKLLFGLVPKTKRMQSNKAFLKLSEKLRKYEDKLKWVDGSSIYYMNLGTDLYDEVEQFCEKHRKGFRFINLGYEIKATEEERAEAVAFFVETPEHCCEEYKGSWYEYEECQECFSKEKTEEGFYVQPKGYVKTHHDDYGMAWIEGTEEALIMPALGKALMEGGVDPKYFQPVLTKRKQLMGYIFVTDNILPEGAYCDPNYKFTTVCQGCGRIIMKEDEEIYRYHQKTMTKEGVECLKDVNYTYEIFHRSRAIIVSKKVGEIIHKYMSNATLFPIFLEK